MLTVGDQFPDFCAAAAVGENSDNLTHIDNKTYNGQWLVYFFYPKDFTFVCPTEIVEFNRRLPDFKDRDAMIVGGSTDNEYAHLAWCQSHEDLGNLDFPLIAAQKLSSHLGILDRDNHVCLRSTFVVDPHGIIQWCATYPLSVGRNVDEVLRVLDAIQSDELCPCNWKQGEKTISV